ncbi:MAG: DUF4417 domain-containing protein [Candidatus Accumulibacter sp.]|jgi:hypothetical protein|nr:DUF4417 domain-containing protein [Accumulibacter sp.]
MTIRRIGFPEAFRGITSKLYFNPEKDVPQTFTARGRWKEGALHTFCDDYRQEFFWRRPEEGLLIALFAGTCTAPDFTIWTDDPKEWRQYQAWRSAIVATYWQENGVAVLPVVSFRSGCHRYVNPGSAWAVRGSVNAQWARDFRTWIKEAKPGLVYVFGRMPAERDYGVDLRSRRLVSSKV